MSTTWNPMSHGDYDVLKGKSVYTRDDEKIGTVDQVLHPTSGSLAPEQHYLLVKPTMTGRISGQDEVYIPTTAVQMVSEDRLILEMTKSSAEREDWTKPGNINNFRRS